MSTDVLGDIRGALETRFGLVPPIIPAVSISSVTTGTKAVFTTTTAHGLTSGLLVRILNYVGGDSALALLYIVEVLTNTTFSLKNSSTKSAIGVTIPGTGASVLAHLVADQNNLYQPVSGVPFQMLWMLPIAPDEPTQGAGFYQERGLFQVTCVYPVGVGIGAIQARAGLIKSFFMKGLTLSNNGLTICISHVPEIGMVRPNANGVEIAVKISYRADVFG